MNMILHGIEAPNIIHTNTLTENLADIQEKDRFEVVLANPPFGGKERKEVQQNFPIRTGETAFLFLQHFIKMLKAGGRGGVVIKNTFLSNTDNASVSLRKLLLESCNLHTVLDCPGGTFQGAGVKTVVLFFEKGAQTRKVWFYQLDPGRNLGKTNPLNDDDLAEFVKLQKTFADSPKVLERGCQDHRQDDLRSFGEKSEWRRGSGAPQPARDHGRDCHAGRRKRGSVGKHQGAAMSKHWQFKELSAVSAISYGYTESASSDQIGPRFLRITDIQDDSVDWESVPYCKIESRDVPKYSLAGGDIVFARTGATTGKNFLVSDPPEAVFASYLIRLRLLDKRLLPEFVSLFFQTDGYWKSIKEGSSGSAQGGFNATKLGALTIPIPSLHEQRRIVGLLDEAFEGIATAKANAEKNLRNARALFESYLEAVFTKRGPGWVEKSLAELCDVKHGFAFKKRVLRRPR